MPLHYVPHQRGVHRVAAIALYRALLRQSTTAPVSAVEREKLQNVVRNQFRRNTNLLGVQRVTVAFDAGYNGLEILQHAIRDKQGGRGTVESFLSRVNPILTVDPHIIATPRLTRKRLEEHVEAASRPAIPNYNTSRSPAILSRKILPLSQIKGGKRIVPFLISAHKIPILRFQKPQPHALGRYIAQRVKEAQKRWDTLHEMDGWIIIARAEDEWDRLVGLGDARKRRIRSWSRPFELVRQRVSAKLTMQSRRNVRIAERMVKIVDRERALADGEEAAAKATRPKATRPQATRPKATRSKAMRPKSTRKT